MNVEVDKGVPICSSVFLSSRERKIEQNFIRLIHTQPRHSADQLKHVKLIAASLVAANPHLILLELKIFYPFKGTRKLGFIICYE